MTLVVSGRSLLETDKRSRQLNRRETILCQLVFILIGISCMYYWNAVINVLYSVIVVRSPNDVVSITNVYTTVAVVCSFLLSVFGAATRAHHFTGGIMLAAMCILFPILALYPSPRLSSIFLHIAGALAGASEMLFQCSGFSFAVLMNKRFAGYVSFGYGACGVITFLIWMLLSQLCFPKAVDGVWAEDQMAKAVWVQFVVGFVLIVSSMVATSFILELPQMKEALRLAQKDVAYAVACSEESAREFFAVPSPTRELSVSGINVYLDTDADSKKNEDKLSVLSKASTKESVDDAAGGWLATNASELWKIFKNTWQLQIGLGLCQGMSMMAYPLIGPYQFNLSTRRNDILTGIFQCGDFLGRYIPNLSLWLPFLLIPAKWMLPLTLMRVVVLILFILTAKATAHAEHSILTNYGTMVTLMASLALTHGYYGSVFMIRMTESLKNPKHKVRASAMAVCLLVACIAIGMWLARLIHF